MLLRKELWLSHWDCGIQCGGSSLFPEALQHCPCRTCGKKAACVHGTPCYLRIAVRCAAVFALPVVVSLKDTFLASPTLPIMCWLFPSSRLHSLITGRANSSPNVLNYSLSRRLQLLLLNLLPSMMLLPVRFKYALLQQLVYPCQLSVQGPFKLKGLGDTDTKIIASWDLSDAQYFWLILVLGCVGECWALWKNAILRHMKMDLGGWFWCEKYLWGLAWMSSIMNVWHPGYFSQVEHLLIRKDLRIVNWYCINLLSNPFTWKLLS